MAQTKTRFGEWLVCLMVSRRFQAKILAPVSVFGRDLHRAYWILLKIMVPALLVVKVLDELGATTLLGRLLEPLMSTVGLPSELGLVWAAALLTNIYTGLVVFYELGAGQTYSVAEMTQLGCLILVAHSLPIEGAVARLTGVPWRLTLALRVIGAYLLAFAVYRFYVWSGGGEADSQLLWRPETRRDGVWAWCVEMLELLLLVYGVLAALMAFLRILRWMGVETLLHAALRPLTLVLGVKRNAAQVTVIGLLLGLSFGAGLLIDESRKGHISGRDMRVVVCFLGVCHSVVEDTLLILLLGAELWAILWLRLVFALLITVMLVRRVYPQPPG